MRRTFAKSAQQSILVWRTETRLANTSVPAGHVTTIRVRIALVDFGFTLVNIQLAMAALKSTSTRTLIGCHTLATILARSIAHG